MNPIVIYVLAGFLFGTAAGTWKPFLGFKKPPPTAQVTKLQADLAAAQEAEGQAKAAEQTARAEERAKLEGQVRAAQTDNVGTVAALKAAPASPEVVLARRMAMRVDLRLAAAIGRLPEAEQQAMLELIEQALSGKQAEVDAANAKLAKADADFKALSGERDALKAEIPKLADKAASAEKNTASVQADLTIQTTKVNEWAAKTDAAERKAGSFFGAFATMRHWAMGIGAVAFGLFGLSLYLRSGLSGAGRALHGLQSVLGENEYTKVITAMDTETDRLHQWMIAGGRKLEATAETVKKL